MSRFRTGLAIAGLGVFVLGGCTAEAAEGGDAASETVSLASADASDLTVTVYKQPSCGCCGSWVELMREAGFEVEVVDTNQIAQVKAEAGIPTALQSCHTAKIGEYVFEGHVPIETIQRFLEEAPDVQGLAVPGMPVGSPGMEMGDRVDPYDVIAFDGLETTVYESRR
jgi:hypothetical protein